MPKFHHRVFHENFEDHQAASDRRVVTEEEADEVWFGSNRQMVANRKAPGRYLMTGLTRGGRSVTVVVLPTDDATTWLLYTAW